jgi:hypothetical protein
MANERGLVISCPVEISGRSMAFRSGPVLDPQELRFSLLFWDKLDFPINYVVGIGPDAETQFLQSAGLLNRTMTQVISGGDVVSSFVQAHIGAFRALDQREPGVWSLSTGKNAISFADDDMELDKGVLVSLYRAIPVPDKDVPLEDILEFRARRRDELITLRHHLEDIYQRVISAGDGELALNTEIERLERAIDDHIKAARGSGLKFRLVDFDANLNLTPAVTATAVAYAASQSIPLSLLTGLGAASLSLKVGPSLKRHEATSTPFKYVSSYHRELF